MPTRTSHSPTAETSLIKARSFARVKHLKITSLFIRLQGGTRRSACGSSSTLRLTPDLGFGRHAREKISSKAFALLFDLNGMLIDSVYQHVLAWREALSEVESNLPFGGFIGESALRTPSLSATAFGICLPLGARGLREWEFYPAVMGRIELERAGAYRVYQDPYDLLKHLDELGVRTPA